MQEALQVLRNRLAHFCKMRDLEMSNGDDSRDAAWKQRTQYLQGRIESLQEAIKLLEKEKQP